MRCLSIEIFKEEDMAYYHEKRKAKRTEVNVTIKLSKVKDSTVTSNLNSDEFEVNVINISNDGMAFKTKEVLALNSLYDSKVALWNNESFNAVIEIIRMENLGEEETLYGCRFVGISSEDRFKIDVFQIVAGN